MAISSSQSASGWAIAALLVGIGLTAGIGYSLLGHSDRTPLKPLSSQSSSSASQKPKVTEPTKPRFSEKPVAIKPGLIRRPKREALAPLAISSTKGSNFYVKIMDTAGRTVMSFYVIGGRYFETQVPLGIYELRYASGQTWYGETHLFGPDTAYAKANKLFDFNFDGTQYNGYTVNLILRSNGNLTTRALSAEEF